MNVLIIGNGFDKAHELPTNYSDFLDFAMRFKQLYESNSISWFDNKASVSYNAHLPQVSEVVKFLNEVGIDIHEQFYAGINTSWFENFRTEKELIGDRWLNFEEIIKTVVTSVWNDKANHRSNAISFVSNPFIEPKIRGFNNYNAIFDFLYSELEKFTNSLRIYLEGYVSHYEPVKRVKQIEQLKIDKLLSFNYTSTYSEYYKIDGVDINYIHGKAYPITGICNMVLGFDDHYLDESITVSELIPFEKYYQRIVKRTDSDYLKWIDEAKKDKELNSFFYGHSMSPADGDTIKKFILATESAHTTIFYLDERDRAEKVRNLAIILGPDELIRRTSGNTATIEFIQIEE